MRMSLLHFVIVGSLMLGMGARAFAQDVPPGDPAHGKQLFLVDGCYQCHGTVGQGGGRAGPRLAPNALPAGLILEQLRHPAAYMPVYTTAVLSDAQAGDIIAYLHSIKPGKPGKDIPLLNVR